MPIVRTSPADSRIGAMCHGISTSAVQASSSVPTFRFGYYTPGNKNDLFELMSQTGTAGGQSVNPNMQRSRYFLTSISLKSRPSRAASMSLPDQRVI